MWIIQVSTDGDCIGLPASLGDGIDPDVYAGVEGWGLYRIISDGEVAALQCPTVEEVRNAKLAEINAKYSTVMAYIQAGYPPEEILSWERQSTQAQALQQNPDAEAAFVRGLAVTKGVSVEEMAQRILANAASWEPIAALLTGQRQVMEECAWAAQTTVAINEIKVGYSV